MPRPLVPGGWWMSSADQQVLRGWADAGLVALTGPAAGPPQVGPGDPAGQIVEGLRRIAEAGRQRTGRVPGLPGVGLLAERAALLGLGRRAPLSVGGAFRAVATTDGHLGLSLARPSDRELIPALVESDLAAGREGAEIWEAIAGWARDLPAREAVERARLLGLPASEIPAVEEVTPPPPPPPPAEAVPAGGAAPVRERPLVVDLSALWAGPLCSDLLRRTGARVVKVESAARPDGARRGEGAFFDLVNEGKQMVALDFASARDRGRLAELIARADLVIEASRPRALRALGVDADEVVAAGTRWLSITARGRDSDAVGFGDDVAVDAGLFVRDRDQTPAPIGDAIADPLTGVAAAALAAEALLEERATMMAVSMWATARAARDRCPVPPEHEVVADGAGWSLRTPGGRLPVASPRARRAFRSAGGLGADTREVLG